MRIATVLALVLAACSRSPSGAGDAGGAPDAASESVIDAAPAAGDAATARAAIPEEEPPATFVGARRARLTTLDDEPGLAKNAAAIKAHFGGKLPAAMELQAVPLATGKQGLLLSAADSDPNPIALLLDANGAPLWTKEHPLAGITPPVKPFAMAPRPDGGLAIFLYDEPTKLVAARMSAVDGAPYAELVLFELARCDAISAAWWPGRGWIVVASFPGGARAQLLKEEGGFAWDPVGIAVGEGWRAPAPATIVIDPRTGTWVLAQHVTRGGGDHAAALHYAADGTRIGSAVDLGAVPRAAKTLDRVEASLARPGFARIDVGGKGVEVAVDTLR
jgi:hypothetical protein